MFDDTASAFANIQESLLWLEEKLFDVTKDVKELNWTPSQKMVGDKNPGLVQNTSQTHSVTQSGDSDVIVLTLPWMELEDKWQDEDLTKPIDGDGCDDT